MILSTLTKLSTILALLAVCVFLQSCSKAELREPKLEELPPLDYVVKFFPDVANIASNNCIQCHSGAAPAAGLDYTTYNDFRLAHEAGLMWPRVTSTTDPMPPSGMLPATDLQKIQKWAEDGYPEN